MAKKTCIDCGKRISRGGTRCKSCAQKAIWTPGRKARYSKRVKAAWQEGIYGNDEHREKLSEAKKRDWENGVYNVERACYTECKICGEKFLVLPSQVALGWGRFCSIACKNKAQCGEGNPMNGKGKFGKENPNWRGGISSSVVVRICEVCGKEFEATPYQIKLGTGRYCSRNCQGVWLSGHLSGPNNVNWCGGHDSYRGPNWHKQAKKTRKRDGYICQSCGLSQEGAGRKLDVHHIMPFREFENYQDANQLENLITLCQYCHLTIEHEQRVLQKEMAR